MNESRDIVSRLKELFDDVRCDEEFYAPLLKEVREIQESRDREINSPIAQAILEKLVATNIGLFLTSAVEHIEQGGNSAVAETQLTDGTWVLLSLTRKKKDSDNDDLLDELDAEAKKYAPWTVLSGRAAEEIRRLMVDIVDRSADRNSWREQAEEMSSMADGLLRKNKRLLGWIMEARDEFVKWGVIEKSELDHIEKLLKECA